MSTAESSKHDVYTAKRWYPPLENLLLLSTEVGTLWHQTSNQLQIDLMTGLVRGPGALRLLRINLQAKPDSSPTVAAFTEGGILKMLRA